MGFFGTVLGGIGGFLLGGPAGALVGAGIGAGVDAANQQADALEQAGDIAGAAELRRQALEEQKFEIAKQLIAEGKPLREAFVQAGLQTLPGLTSFADITKAGTGPGFNIPLRQGLRGLSAELAPFGSTLGTSPQLTAGVTERLLSSDIGRRLGVGQSLLGLAPTGAGTGVGLLGQTGGTGLAGLQSQIASQSPQAGLFGDLANLGVFAGTGGIDFSQFRSPFSGR